MSLCPYYQESVIFGSVSTKLTGSVKFVPGKVLTLLGDLA